MHPWHDIYVDEKVIETAFPVIIEVPTGSKNKYELDKESGLLKLDRVLYSAVHYPANYGFIPRSFCDDGDPLDALVLTMEPLYPLTVVDARAIAVCNGDPSFDEIHHHTDLPSHTLRQIRRFFQDYKVLENKEVVIDEIMDKDEAIKVMTESLSLYRQLRRGEVKSRH